MTTAARVRRSTRSTFEAIRQILFHTVIEDTHGPSTISRNPLFDVQDLSKIYRLGDVEVHALRNVTLMLPESEFVVLLGPSGSGNRRCSTSSAVLIGRRADAFSTAART